MPLIQALILKQNAEYDQHNLRVIYTLGKGKLYSLSRTIKKEADLDIDI